MATSNATSPGFVPLMTPYSGLAQNQAAEQARLAAQASDNVGNFMGSVSDGVSAVKGAYDLYSWLDGGTAGAAGEAASTLTQGFTGLEGGLNLSGTNFASDIGSGLGNVSSGSSALDSLSTAFDGIGLTDYNFGNIGSSVASAGVGLAAGFAGRTVGGWLGADGAGADIGSTIGGAIGSYVGGPLGTFVGSTLGSLVGGLFGGGGTPHPASYFSGGYIQPDGSAVGTKYGAKHVGEDVAKGIEGGMVSYLKKQAKKYGTAYSDGITLSGGYEGLDGGQFGKGASIVIDHVDNPGKAQKIFKYDPKDADSMKKAQEEAWKYTLALSGIDYNTLQVPAANASMSEVQIPKVSGPSDWDNFLANYRAQNEPSTTTSA